MPFLSQLQKRALLFDGPVSTFLTQHKKEHGCELYAALNSKCAVNILDAHQSFLNAGADIIRANTCDANPLLLKKHGKENKLEEYIQCGIALCHEAISSSGKEAFVASEIGPCGCYYTKSPDMPKKMYQAFFDMCRISEASGADMIFIRNITDIKEMRLALLAAKAASQLPVLCCFSPSPYALSPSHTSLEAAILCCDRLNASLSGFFWDDNSKNTLIEGFNNIKDTSTPFFAIFDGLEQNNAASIDELLKGALTMLKAGAHIIGIEKGCTPAHTAALKKLIDKYQPHKPQKKQCLSYISSPGICLPLNSITPQETLILKKENIDEAINLIRIHAREGQALHIDFGDWSGDNISALIFRALSSLHKTPIAVHVNTASQAKAALLSWPGIALLYANSDAYQALKTGIKYGAEVIQ